MRKWLLTPLLGLVLTGAIVTTAYARDDFETGFKRELGAITARSAVGLGVGVVNGIFGGGVAYNGLYVRPAPIYRPYYRERVVYTPAPPPPYYRVETRCYAPCYVPPPPPPPVYRHYEYHYYERH